MYGRVVTTIHVKPVLDEGEIESGLWQEVEDIYPHLNDHQEYGGSVLYIEKDGKIYGEHEVRDKE